MVKELHKLQRDLLTLQNNLKDTIKKLEDELSEYNIQRQDIENSIKVNSAIVYKQFEIPIEELEKSSNKNKNKKIEKLEKQKELSPYYVNVILFENKLEELNLLIEKSQVEKKIKETELEVVNQKYNNTQNIDEYSKTVLCDFLGINKDDITNRVFIDNRGDKIEVIINFEDITIFVDRLDSRQLFLDSMYGFINNYLYQEEITENIDDYFRNTILTKNSSIYIYDVQGRKQSIYDIIRLKDKKLDSLYIYSVAPYCFFSCDNIEKYDQLFFNFPLRSKFVLNDSLIDFIVDIFSRNFELCKLVNIHLNEDFIFNYTKQEVDEIVEANIGDFMNIMTNGVFPNHPDVDNKYTIIKEMIKDLIMSIINCENIYEFRKRIMMKICENEGDLDKIENILGSYIHFKGGDNTNKNVDRYDKNEFEKLIKQEYNYEEEDNILRILYKISIIIRIRGYIINCESMNEPEYREVEIVNYRENQESMTEKEAREKLNEMYNKFDRDIYKLYTMYKNDNDNYIYDDVNNIDIPYYTIVKSYLKSELFKSEYNYNTPSEYTILFFMDRLLKSSETRYNVIFNLDTEEHEIITDQVDIRKNILFNQFLIHGCAEKAKEIMDVYYLQMTEDQKQSYKEFMQTVI